MNTFSPHLKICFLSLIFYLVFQNETIFISFWKPFGTKCNIFGDKKSITISENAKWWMLPFICYLFNSTPYITELLRLMSSLSGLDIQLGNEIDSNWRHDQYPFFNRFKRLDFFASVHLVLRLFGWSGCVGITKAWLNVQQIQNFPVHFFRTDGLEIYSPVWATDEIWLAKIYLYCNVLRESWETT